MEAIHTCRGTPAAKHWKCGEPGRLPDCRPVFLKAARDDGIGTNSARATRFGYLRALRTDVDVAISQRVLRIIEPDSNLL
jgi:hypothetical protein